MYEGGWGKQLSYIVACSFDEVVDVTRRYTKKWDAVLTRRSLPEAAMSSLIDAADASQRSTVRSLPVGRTQFLARRREIEERHLAGNIAFDDGMRKEEEALGRISGSMAWRVARGEVGVEPGAPSATATAQDVPIRPHLLSGVPSSLPRHASPAANAGATSCGWELLSHECAEANRGGGLLSGPHTAPPVRGLFSSWGRQLIAASPGGQFWWRQLVAPAPATSAQWKPIAIFEADGSTEKSWPPPGHTVVGLTADPIANKFYVATHSALAPGTESVALAAASAPHLRGAITARESPAALVAPVVRLWLVQPSSVAGQRSRWMSAELAPLPARELAPLASLPSLPGGLPMCVANGHLFIVLDGHLVVSQSLVRDSHIGVPIFDSSRSVWTPLCPAPGISALAANKLSMIIGYREGVVATSSSRAQDSAIVLLVHIPPASVPSSVTGASSESSASAVHLRMASSPSGTAGAPAIDSGAVPLLGPCLLPIADLAANDPGGGVRPSHETCCTLRVDPISPSSVVAARSRHDWFAFVALGMVSETSYLRGIELSPLPAPPGADAEDAEPGNCESVENLLVPTRSLPTSEGLYELRHFCGPAWSGGLVATSGLCIAAGIASAASTGTNGLRWVSLCPASNVSSLAACVIGLAGAEKHAILALTNSGDLWGFDLPPTAVSCASDEAKRHLEGQVSIAAGTMIDHVIDVQAIAPAVSALEAGPAPRYVSGLQPPLGAPSGTRDLNTQALFARLFHQLTIGHGSTVPCNHMHCASNPSFASLSPTEAATRALQLVALGAPSETLLCLAGEIATSASLAD
jgi:hypothetical protein